MKRWLSIGLAGVLALAAAVYVGSCGTRRAPPPEPGAESASTTPAAEPEASAETASPDDSDTGTATNKDKNAEPPTEAVLESMREARDCYQDPDCNIDADDPRQHYYEAGKAVAEGLRELRARHRAGELSDAELAAAAREFMAFDNPHARSESLAAMSQVPPDPRNLDTIIDALDQKHTPRLFEAALHELRRYHGEKARERIEGFLQSNLRTGAHHAAETIARGLTPFLDPDNVDDFEAIADELPDESRRAELIRNAIDEYRRRRSDG